MRYKEESFGQMVRQSYAFNQYYYDQDDHWGTVSALYSSNYLHSEETEQRIPKKIHQIWLGGEVPEKYKYFMQSWQRFHPDWEYRLWNDEDAESFGMERIDAYHASNNMGTKSDIFSYEILRRHGGLYVDTDFECLKPFDDLLFLRFFTSIAYDGRLVLYHGLMASEPEHNILKTCVDDLKQYTGEDGTRIMDATGPYHLTRSFFNGLYAHAEGVVAFPQSFFYPMPNNKRHDDNPRKYIKPHSYAIHYFSVSWLK